MNVFMFICLHECICIKIFSVYLYADTAYLKRTMAESGPPSKPPRPSLSQSCQKHAFFSAGGASNPWSCPYKRVQEGGLVRDFAPVQGRNLIADLAPPRKPPNPSL